MRSTLVMLLATSAACLTPYCNIPVRIKLWEMTSPTFPLLVVPSSNMRNWYVTIVKNTMLMMSK
jgi:hypothetical protein